CELMYYSGCRISEALSLTRADIDASEAVVRIRCLKKRVKLVVRRIPLPPEFVSRLITFGESSADRLWGFSRMTGWRVIKKALKMAGIQGLHASPKGLRHGFGVRAALANVPISIIQRWMGHSSVSTTSIYLSVRDDEERDLMARTWSTYLELSLRSST
ncbi:MAG: site-specific integrase, partial [Verrucomicrobiaceae bacterium]